MYNDFILIGPKSDPAGVKGKDIETALKAIKAKAAPFVSRGDKSGTHSAELALWKAAGIDVAGADKGPWYREIGQGMGAALNTASSMNGYVLADRGTWLSFKNRGELDIVVEGDKRLFNQYGVMLVNPAKHRACEEGARPAVHRLAGLGGRPEGDRRLQDQRRRSCSSRTPRCRGRDDGLLAVIAIMERHACRRPTPPIRSLLHAAGSLRGALTEVAKAFEAASGVKVQAKYGPSGTLRDEIAGGAKAEVFASANMDASGIARRKPARAARSCCSRATGCARWSGRDSR